MSRTDNLSVEDRSRTMRSVRSQDTGPERIVRRVIHSLGFRYRLNRKDLPGKPDIVFVSRKKVIFVHGCFWHGHSCKAGAKRPKTNIDYWITKLERNKQRDLLNYQKLAEMGWQYLVIWECEIKDLNSLQEKIVAFLGDDK
ncbi:MAG: very short patch repair endonuclease [Anaerolineales bacterium]